MDDFFSLIRSFYNYRAYEPEFLRITFVFLGVASPFYLIKNKESTPFNIGKAIALEPFEMHEITPLTKGLKGKYLNPKNILEAILSWTGGQPFLTQKLCRIVSRMNDNIPEGSEKVFIDNLVAKEIIENWESKDEPQHLKTIRDRLISKSSPDLNLIELYKHLLKVKQIETSENSPIHMKLLLTGLVYKKEGKIILYNKIYEIIFNEQWITEELQIL